jgi:ubiquinol-cytochrome c reductase cytochrome b subunit
VRRRRSRTTDAVAFVDERLGAAQGARKALRYVFPDHWSFMLGEMALYCFVVLVVTGVYLALYFEPSRATTVYTGVYGPLRGETMSLAYESVLHISLSVEGGLLIRQAHHWAADIFLAAIVVHLMRVFFTGAFRKPRDINWAVGVTMLGMALLEGFLGYSLIDDLLSGMGLVIAYSVAMSLPFVGSHLTVLLFGDAWPGGPELWPRMFITHVLLLPMAIAALIALHLAIIVRQHHTQFRGRRRTETNVVGTPMWPGYALRSLGLFAAVAAVVFLLGGLVQINPIWEWGPYHTYLGTNGAQPDWYLGWLIGGLRLMPPFEPHLWGYTIAPNPFWGGALFPTVVFLTLYAWPAIDRRLTGDRRVHHLLDLPRDNPRRTAIGAAFLAWVVAVFALGSLDRVAFALSVPYEGQVWFWRFGAVLLPLVVYAVARRVAAELRRGRAHVLRGWYGQAVERTPSGGFTALPPGAAEDEAATPDAERR